MTKLNGDFCHATDPKQLISLLSHFSSDSPLCFSTEINSNNTFPKPIKIWIRGEFTGEYFPIDLGIADSEEKIDLENPILWDEFQIQFESKQEFIESIVSIWIPENLYFIELQNFLKSIELEGLVELIDNE